MPLVFSTALLTTATAKQNPKCLLHSSTKYPGHAQLIVHLQLFFFHFGALFRWLPILFAIKMGGSCRFPGIRRLEVERAGGQDSAAIRLALRDVHGWGKVCHPRSPRRRWYRPVARACQEVRAKKFGEGNEAIPQGDEYGVNAWSLKNLGCPSPRTWR